MAKKPEKILKVIVTKMQIKMIRLTPIIPATQEAEIGRIAAQGQPSNFEGPISKITRIKWTEGVA
jgi:hypothetical protein